MTADDIEQDIRRLLGSIEQSLDAGDWLHLEDLALGLLRFCVRRTDLAGQEEEDEL